MVGWYLSHPVHGNRPWAVQAAAAEARASSSNPRRFGYFLEQGLGKTSLALNDFVASDEVEVMVVLSPNSFKSDWVAAPAEWGVSHIRAGMWPRDRVPMDRSEYDLYAVNYEAARDSAFSQLCSLMEARPTFLVVDEGTAIMNPNSKQSKKVYELSKRALQCVVLNGTPFTKNVMDIFTTLKCLGQLNGWKSTTFRSYYAAMGGYMGKNIIGVREGRDQELYAMLGRCAFRAMKADWRKDLPPQLDVTVNLQMTKKQAAHYREMVEDFYTQVADVEVSAQMVLTKMERLRQISSCLAMDGAKFQMIEEGRSNPKLAALEDIFHSGSGKLIAVYMYRPSGGAIFNMATSMGLKPAWLRGQMKPEDLAEEKRRFNEDPSCRILVAQESAGCRGHTLLGGEGADRCTRMVFYENSFALWERLQMRDRNHRGAQDQPCTYYDLVTSPMDRAVIKILQDKRELANHADEVIKAVRVEGERLR